MPSPRGRIVYTFRDDSERYPLITMIKTTAPNRRGPSPTRRVHSSVTSLHTITLATYNRFVDLANRSRHRTMITKGSPLAWELWVEP